jgi:hypothetical protein
VAALERQTAVRGGHRAGVASVSVAEPSGFMVVLCLCAERVDEDGTRAAAVPSGGQPRMRNGLDIALAGGRLPSLVRGTAARLVCLFYR